MNDSLNMISKSRNKLINKSFQQQLGKSGGSSVKRSGLGNAGILTTSVTGDNSSKLGSTPNHSNH